MVNERSLDSALTTDHMNERDNLKRMRARMRTYDYINQKKMCTKNRYRCISRAHLFVIKAIECMMSRFQYFVCFGVLWSNFDGLDSIKRINLGG